MFRAVKIKLYPTKYQKNLIHGQIGASRFIYNYFLNYCIERYKNGQKLESMFDLMKKITVLKKTPEYEWLNLYHAQTLQLAVENLYQAYKRFFKLKIGHPKFRSRRHPKKSFQFSQDCEIEGNKIYIPKIGWIKAKGIREINGQIKRVTVRRTPSDEYYAALCCDDKIKEPEKKPIKKERNYLLTCMGHNNGFKERLKDHIV